MSFCRPLFYGRSICQNAALFLLNAVSGQKLGENTEAEKDFRFSDGSSMDRILRGVQPVPESIRIATARPEVVESAADYFRGEVMQDIHPHLKEEATERLRSLGDDVGQFLSETFIYAMNRPCNPDSGDSHQKISVSLLVFLFLFGITIYGMTMFTMMKMGTVSQALILFAFFFTVVLFVFLIGFYFFLWRRDI